MSEEANLGPGQRWPRWIYEAGDEPDYRFSFANERTFLAWIRTALALLAGGVALDAVDLSLSTWVQQVLAVVLVLLGLCCALVSWLRWAQAERAMRRHQGLPSTSMGAVLAAALVLSGLILLVALAASA